MYALQRADMCCLSVRLSTADLFVPCGGRPESVNTQNVDRMFHKDGRPRFKYIVEGANLFITPVRTRAHRRSHEVLL